jgi:hypothetical protein
LRSAAQICATRAACTTLRSEPPVHTLTEPDAIDRLRVNGLAQRPRADRLLEDMLCVPIWEAGPVPGVRLGVG